MVYGGIMAFIIALFIVADRSENCAMNNGQMNIKTWLIVAVGNYVADFILLLA
jgi:hypothetical protein